MNLKISSLFFFLITFCEKLINAQICTQYNCTQVDMRAACYIKLNPLLINIQECDYSEYCDLKSGNCKNSVYPKYQQYNGGPCNDNSDCLKGVCDKSQNICVRQIPESSNCQNSLDCKIGFYCSTDKKICQSLKNLNETCFSEEECQVNLSCSTEKNTCINFFSLPENSTVFEKYYLCASGITFDNKCSEAALKSDINCTDSGYCLYYNEKSGMTINSTLSCKCGINPYGGRLCDYGAEDPAISKQINMYKDLISNQDEKFCHTLERMKLCVSKAFDFQNKTAEYNYKKNVFMNFNLNYIQENIQNYKIKENDILNKDLEKNSNAGFNHLNYLDNANYNFLNMNENILSRSLKTNNFINYKEVQKLSNSLKDNNQTHNKFDYDKQMRLINNVLTLTSNQFKNNTYDYCGYSVIGSYSKYLVPPVSQKSCIKYDCSSSTKQCLQSYNPNNWDSSNITVTINNNVCNKKNESCYYETKEIFALENYSGKCINNSPTPRLSYNRYPGEACRDDADCFNKLCIKGYCYSKNKGDLCDKNYRGSHYCGLGLFCGRFNITEKEDSCIDLKATGEECNDSFECKMNLICYNGICAKELFSIQNDKKLFVENINDDYVKNNPSLLCESGKFFKQADGICASYELLNKTNGDGYAECDIEDKNSCVYQVKSDFSNYTFTQQCECGYNSEGKSYCPIDFVKCKDFSDFHFLLILKI